MLLKTAFYAGAILLLVACASTKKNTPADAGAITDNIQNNTDTVAKPGWQVLVNKQLVLQSNTEDAAVNSRIVKAADLFNTNLQIIYTETPDAQLNRSYIIMDNNRRELFRTENTKQPIAGAALKKAAGGETTLVVYTLAIPSDPALAATVRVRPVHLCTLILQ